MAITAADKRILFQRSGNRCAYPRCTRELVLVDAESDDPTSVSEIAHIVAQELGGPRGTYPLPMEERDKYDNLILLCEQHHHYVDDNPETFPVEKLRRYKAEHEALIRQATGDAVELRVGSQPADTYVDEDVFSTLLSADFMPRYVYSATCKFVDGKEKEAKEKVVRPGHGIMTPFIIRAGRLFAFNNLELPDNPFVDLISDPKTVTRHMARDWWFDPDKLNWYLQLLNRSLNVLTGRKRLNLDRKHKRYYFEAEEAEQSLEVTYTSLNRAKATRQVVWQPITKRTGEGKSYWFHLAVALRFYLVGRNAWCLSIRPEMHVSKDGKEPYPSEKIGARVTKKKSKKYNFDLLGDVQFWRDYLSGGSPRINLSFGDQAIVIKNELLHSQVHWPGMPEEHAKSFTNVVHDDDLFSWAEYQGLIGDEEESDWDEDEDDEADDEDYDE